MKLFFLIFIVTLLFSACDKKLNVKGKEILVKVGNKVLYKNTVEDNIPAGIPEEDSLIAAEHFIHTWINEHLLYDIALKNCDNKETIEQFV